MSAVVPSYSLIFTQTPGQATTFNSVNLPRYTLLIGKNNSGKSHLLTSFYDHLRPDVTNGLNVFYISPERFGDLMRNSSIEEANSTNRHGRDRDRLKNQSSDFITDAVSSFNTLIAQLNRKPRKDKTLKEIEQSLNNKIEGMEFTYNTSNSTSIYHFLINGHELNPSADRYSSGTSQVIALIMSVLYFVYSKRYSEDAYLLIDEPDVHIHPDLQYDFAKFLIGVAKNTQHKVIIATHSSSIISAFSGESDAQIAVIDRADKDKLNFYSFTSYLNNLLPSIGAHSLSHVFNKSPILLLEGEDDAIVWQTAIRKSSGKLRFHLVEVDGKPQFTNYENLINDIASNLFDNPAAFEIRDRDFKPGTSELQSEELDDKGAVKRSRLRCHEIENLILSNEVLKYLGYEDWDAAKAKLQEKGINISDRLSEDLKTSIQRIIISLKPDNNKSWELIVGLCIGSNINSVSNLRSEEGSIYYMLGDKISNWLTR